MLTKDLSQPARSDDEHPGAVEGDGQLLHGDLNGPFGGGWGVSGMAMRGFKTFFSKRSIMQIILEFEKLVRRK